MKIRLLPSVVGGSEPEQYLSSILVDDTNAIDAGSLGFHGTPAEQARVRRVFLSHSHFDHIASLPIFLENVFDQGGDGIAIHGSRFVLDCLRRDVFNNRLWPDFVQLSREGIPFLRLEELQSGRPVEVDGLRVTPLDVEHVVPTQAFLLESDDAGVLVATDTGPSPSLWEAVNRAPRLDAVFLGVAFPDSMTGLAGTAKHLTPRTFAEEIGRLERPARVFAIHLKARYRAEIVEELGRLGLGDRVEVAIPGREIRIGSGRRHGGA